MTENTQPNISDFHRKNEIHNRLSQLRYATIEGLKAEENARVRWNFDGLSRHLAEDFGFNRLNEESEALLTAQIKRAREVAADEEAFIKFWHTRRVAMHKGMADNIQAAAEALRQRGIAYVKCDFEGGGDVGCVHLPAFYKPDGDGGAVEEGAAAEDLDIPEGDYEGCLKVQEPKGSFEWVSYWYDENLALAKEPYREKKTLSELLKEILEAAIDRELGCEWWDGGTSTDGAAYFCVEDQTIRVRRTQTVTEDTTSSWSVAEELQELEIEAMAAAKTEPKP